MSDIVLIDTSGSMLKVREEVEEALEPYGEDDVIFGIKCDDPFPIEVLSDRGEPVDIDIEFDGGTPLSDAIDAVSKLTTEPIIVVTDGWVDSTSEFKKYMASVESELRIHLLSDHSPIDEEVFGNV